MSDPDVALAKIALDVAKPRRGNLITPAVPVLAPERVLWCFGKCNDWTVQELKPIGREKYYICRCGFKSLYLIVRPIERKESF
jgi:hypothetical protein